MACSNGDLRVCACVRARVGRYNTLHCVVRAAGANLLSMFYHGCCALAERAALCLVMTADDDSLRIILNHFTRYLTNLEGDLNNYVFHCVNREV